MLAGCRATERMPRAAIHKQLSKRYEQTGPMANPDNILLAKLFLH